MNMLSKAAIAAAVAIAFAPGVASAQNDADRVATDTTQTTTVHKEDKDFPWGLLGLLGLAGLLGRKRNDADIHVDARRDNTTTTRP